MIRSHVMLGRNRRKNHNIGHQDVEVGKAAVDFHHSAAWAGHLFVSIPQKVGTDLSFTTFPDTIDPQAAAEALRRKSIQYPAVTSSSHKFA